MAWKIPLFKIYWDEEDVRSIEKVIRSGMYWAEGSSIEEFEGRLTKYMGAQHCIVFNSGTSALHAALLAYGVKDGDEVIVPSFTFIATANAPLFVGAKPVFADIEEETLGLDPRDVRKRITSKTKAIIPVHYGGSPCKIAELRKIAKEYNLFLIEDAAESFGAKIGEKMVGTFGDAAILSFCQNKIISTGEGGAVITDSSKIYERLKLIRSHGRSEGQDYFSSVTPSDYIGLGYNFRMPSCIAALGIAQLKKINKILKMRQEKAGYFTKKLNRVSGEIITPNPPKNYFHAYQLYTVRIKKYDRDGLKKYLSREGIMTKVYFPPVHLTRFYRAKFRQASKLPVTEKISKQALSLPMHPRLKNEEIDYMVKKIINFLRRKDEENL